MTPDLKTLPWFTSDRPSAWYLIGHTREILRSLPDNSVDLVLSSPPFFALRSYLPSDHKDKHREIGAEPTPAAFIDTLLDVTEECARVLTPTGSLCFELGDTYSGFAGSGGDYNKGGLKEVQGKFQQQGMNRNGNPSVHPDKDRWVGSDKRPGYPLAKSLSLIPESFRWALAYGRNPFNGRETEQWRVRNVVRWHRTNPPVGALGDKFRCATSEIVVACKSDKRWFDLDAVRTNPVSEGDGSMSGYAARGQTPRMVLRTTNPGGAPPLDTWIIPTQPYKGSHYAVWPEELCRIPVLSMCPKEVCRVCGKPRRRITRTVNSVGRALGRRAWMDGTNGIGAGHVGEFTETTSSAPSSIRETLGWTDCGHNDYRPGVVLDPFGGTGTTAREALARGRSGVLIDIDKRNFDLARQRVGFWLQEFDVAAE